MLGSCRDLGCCSQYWKYSSYRMRTGSVFPARCRSRGGSVGMLKVVISMIFFLLLKAMHLNILAKDAYRQPISKEKRKTLSCKRGNFREKKKKV